FVWSVLLASPMPPQDPSAPISQSEWKAMLARAQNGGVIDLGKRRVDFARIVFQPAARVTIKGGVFGPVTLDKWRNVTFDGATFEGPPGTPEVQSLMLAYEPQHLTVRNCRFSGYRRRPASFGSSAPRSAAERMSRSSTATSKTWRAISAIFGLTEPGLATTT
ncbi:MAG TPA: hypothetical protein VE567_01600, partial [Sphingomonas sp.]|nr:hypothetical protein [Sphingomonas sp.]